MDEKNYTISDEELNRILLSSPLTLPDSPSNAGMSAGQIKKHFYKFIILLVKKINEKLADIYDGKDSSVSAHNTASDAHADIREILSLLEDEVEALSQVDGALGNQITSSISEHNLSASAHDDIRQAVSNADSKAQNALTIAQGRSKAVVYDSVSELVTVLTGGLDSLCVGDSVYVKGQGEPDFWVSKKYDEMQASTIPESISAGCTLTAGYYELVGFESGVDTSVFAKDADLDALASEVSCKENARELETATGDVTLEGGKEYDCGTRTLLTLNLPDTLPDGYDVIVSFISGATATTLDAPENLVFKGDDCSGGHLYPIKNRIYEINIKKICSVPVGVVSSVDYEVIE